jgi:hypothetical protein
LLEIIVATMPTSLSAPWELLQQEKAALPGKNGKQVAYPDASDYLCRIKRIFNLLKY